MAARGESEMPAPRPPEFRRRAVELARPRKKPIARTARTWDRRIMPAQLMARAGVDEGWSASSLRS